MEAELKLKMQYDSKMIVQAEKPYINVLPNYPYEAYRRFDTHTLSQIRKTERVPLPQLRQLILLYILQQKQTTFLGQSEFLRHKLDVKGHQANYGTLYMVSERLIREQQRLQKLADVFGEYYEYREQLISRTVMKSMHNIHEEAQKFKKEVKVVEQDKAGKVGAFMGRVQRQRSQGPGRMGQEGGFQLSMRDQEELTQIQKEANLKILNIIRSQDQHNVQYESNQQERLRGLRYLATYLNQFEKALIFLVSARHVSNINLQNSLANENYYITFKGKLEEFRGKIRALKDEMLDHLFDWTMSMKHDRPHQTKGAEYEHRSNFLASQMETQLYNFVPNILVNIQKDRQDLRTITQFFTKNFQNYLGTYYSIKEVQLYHSKQSHIEEVIENERHNLNAHLKKNFGMMVPYKKSGQYEQLSSLAISRQKPYLKSLMQQKISFLQQAIAYINYEHSNLYKQACSNSPGISSKIKRKLQQFQKLSARCPQIKAHLEQSCQRLLQVINH